jgi:activator of HSP90 ATPase
VDIRKSYLIDAPRDAVWKALTDPADIEAWGAGPTVMDAREGTEFSLWGGDIHGTNTQVEDGSLLVQEWYGGDWPKPSIATFKLADEDGKTRVDLVHTDVPDDEAADFDAGWDDYYLGAIKEWLEGRLTMPASVPL